MNDTLRDKVIKGLEKLVLQKIGTIPTSGLIATPTNAAKDKAAKDKAAKDKAAKDKVAKDNALADPINLKRPIPVVEPGYVVIRTTDVIHKKVRTADGESTVITTIDGPGTSSQIGPIISEKN